MPKITKKKIPTNKATKSKKSTKNKLSYTSKTQKEKKNQQAEQMTLWRTICGKYRRNKPILSTFLLEFVLLIFHNSNAKYPIYNVLTDINELPLSVNYRTMASETKDHLNFNRLPATSKFKFLLSIDDDSVIEKYLDNLKHTMLTLNTAFSAAPAAGDAVSQAATGAAGTVVSYTANGAASKLVVAVTNGTFNATDVVTVTTAGGQSSTSTPSALSNDDVFSEFDAVSQQYPVYKAQMEAGEWGNLQHLNGKEIRGLVDALGSIENPEEGNLSGTTNSSQEETVCKRLFPWMFQGGRKKRKTKKRKKRKTLKHKRKRKTKNKRKKKK